MEERGTRPWNTPSPSRLAQGASPAQFGSLRSHERPAVLHDGSAGRGTPPRTDATSPQSSPGLAQRQAASGGRRRRASQPHGVENPVLTPEQFSAKLLMVSINVLGTACLDIWFDDPERLFWGHGVYVESFDGTDLTSARRTCSARGTRCLRPDADHRRRRGPTVRGRRRRRHRRPPPSTPRPDRRSRGLPPGGPSVHRHQGRLHRRPRCQLHHPRMQRPSRRSA